MADKVYVPKANAKELKFSNGGSLIKLGFKASELVEFIQRHTNDKGYLNLAISPRQSPGKYGETHSVYLDTYQPKPKSDDDGPIPF